METEASMAQELAGALRENDSLWSGLGSVSIGIPVLSHTLIPTGPHEPSIEANESQDGF